MANPTWLADVLRKSGLRVWEDPGWKGRGHGTMGLIVGVLCHHTAGGGSNDWRVVRDGRAGLAGPLAQMTLERDGLIRVLAAGVSWHAGNGSHPNLPGASNYNLLGIEGVSTGRWGDWTAAQMDVYPKMVAAILRHCELPVTRAVGHKEWAPRRKIDPSFDMNAFRHNVARFLRAPEQPASGGIESMAFNDSYTDWAGNRQTVQAWMDHVDKRLYEIHRETPTLVESARTWLFGKAGVRHAGHGAVTVAEMYATLSKVSERLGTIEAKLDVLEEQHGDAAAPLA